MNLKRNLLVVCFSFVFSLNAQTSENGDQLYATGNYTRAIEAYKAAKEID
jgi:hypothetical protein